MDPVVLALTISTTVLALLVVFLTGMLLGRSRRPVQWRTPHTPEPAPPEATFPRESVPWPDERQPTIIDRSPRPQLEWGDHRLYFDDGRYFFSDADAPDPAWDRVGQVPKDHRIVVGRDGTPRIERGTATNRPVSHRRD